MHEKDFLKVILSVILLFALPLSGWCAEPQKAVQHKMVLTLSECVQRSMEISPEIQESRHEEGVYQAKKRQVDASAFPTIDILAFTGPSPEARKEQLSTTDYTLKINGIFASTRVEVIQPLYTFGKYENYLKAAQSGIKVARAGVQKKTSDVILRTKEFYYSLLLARDLRNLVLEIRDRLFEAIKKTEKQIAEGSPWADEMNLFKLRAFLGEVEKGLAESDKGVALAKDALKTSLGLQKGQDFDIAETSLTPEERMPETVDISLIKAREYRPEFAQLQEGLVARDAFVEVEKSHYYPVFFAGAWGYFAAASNRDKVNNPYIFDYFNQNYGAAFLGLKWTIDFGVTKARVNEAIAEKDKLVEKKKFADEAIPLQVRKSYLDLEEAGRTIGETEKAYNNAKKWLVSASANYDLGVGEAKDIADAAFVYAKMRADNLKARFNHRMAFANLLYATGTDVREFK